MVFVNVVLGPSFRHCSLSSETIADFGYLRVLVTTRWTTTRSSKVNLPHTIEFRASWVTRLVTYPADFRGNEPCVARRVATFMMHIWNYL